MPKIVKDMANEIMDDGNSSDTANVPAPKDVPSRSPIRRLSSTVSRKEIHDEVFGTSPALKPPMASMVESKKSTSPTSSSTSENRPRGRTDSELEEQNMEKEKAEAERTYNGLLRLSIESKNWAKQVGPNAVKFLSEFVRIHKAHESNLKNLASAADTISAIADQSIKVSKDDDGEGEEVRSCELQRTSNVTVSSKLSLHSLQGDSEKIPGRTSPVISPSTASNNSESIDWAAVAYCLTTAATEVGQMNKTVNESTHKKYQHMQMEQSHLQSQVERETGKVLKMRSEAKYALEQARDKKAKAQAAVERLLSSVADSSAPTAPKASNTMSGLIKKMKISREVNENKATDQSKKLFKRLQECEIEVKAAEYHLQDTIEKADEKMPVFVRDLKLLSATRESGVKDLMKEVSYVARRQLTKPFPSADSNTFNVTSFATRSAHRSLQIRCS